MVRFRPAEARNRRSAKEPNSIREKSHVRINVGYDAGANIKRLRFFDYMSIIWGIIAISFLGLEILSWAPTRR